MSSIRVSEKHGVNPSIEVCYLCGEDKGLILFGRMKGDEQAPHRVCINKEPCDKCKDYMKQGVILIEVRDGESGDDPYRMGGYAVVSQQFIERVISTPELAQAMLKQRVAYIETSTWDMLGIPRGQKETAGGDRR